MLGMEEVYEKMEEMAAKDDKERAEIIAQTRKDARLIRATYKERQEKIIHARRESLLRMRAENEAVAVKIQLMYRRKVLEQKLIDAKLWNFSEHRVIFTPEQMISKLKQVIRQPLSKPIA